MGTAKDSPEQEVYEGMAAILRAGDLPPGTKLGEVELAGAFGVSRERVRKVLVRLGSERMIDLIPNRGAFVPIPTLGAVRQAFDARRMVEAGIAIFLATRLTEFELTALDAVVAGEHRTGNSKGKGESQEDFHLEMAQLTGNNHIALVLRELVGRTSMLAPHGSGAAPLCGHREHEHIVAALKERNGSLAAELVAAHLSTMETRLRPPEEAAASEVSVASVIKERLRGRRATGTKGRPASARASAKKRA